ncbi:MAG: ISL3 family transposase [Endozoicomonas sp.]
MRDKELYAQILGIKSPWVVHDVQLSYQNTEVTVSIDLKPNARLTCPHCAKTCSGYDTRVKRWRHLDTCQFRTILEARVPRIQCLEHGVKTIQVPWAEPGSGFTAMFEALVIDWLHEASTQAVSRQMRLSWNAIDNIMQRAVKRGLKRRELQPLKHIGIDETSFQKRHEYVTVVVDQERDIVVHVADERKKESLNQFYDTLSEQQLSELESVSMDMWPAFINTTLDRVPDAGRKIAFDKFHIAKALGEAVDKVRRQEHKVLAAEGHSILTGSKYQWLANPENMSEKQWQDFLPLKNRVLKTARAWAIKELAMTLWHYSTRGWAIKAWKRWLGWGLRCRLEPVRKVALMIREHLWGIVNAIILSVDNGRSESMNAKIQRVKRRACGFRNRDRFRAAIYFHCGGLELYPCG